MTLRLAVAAGNAAVASLAEAAARSAQSLCVARHEQQSVVWDPGDPWLDVHDEDGVLAIVDGRLHAGARSARELPERYRRLGAGVAAGLLGDFVLVVLDRGSQSLLVARDPVGVRPWYQGAAGDNHIGAGTLAAVAAFGWVDRSVDDRTAIEFLAGRSQSTGRTFYRGISTLLPGRTWRRQANRGSTIVHAPIVVAPELDVAWSDAVLRTRDLLDQSVAARLRPGRPATCQLSGGLDSTAVVGTARLAQAPDLAVGRLVFDSGPADERAFSDAVIAEWGLTAVSVPPWIPTAEDAAELTRRLARPLPDPNFLMFTSLDRALAAEGRNEVLTGLGGDDAFVAMATGSRVLSAVQLGQRDVLRRIAVLALREPGRVWREFVRPTYDEVAPRRRPSAPAWVSSRASIATGLTDTFARRPERVTGVAAIDRRLDAVTSGYHASILEDRALLGDLTGHRNTHPFLDPRMITGTYGLDPWWPMANGHYRALEVVATRDRVPGFISDRRTKAEFSSIAWTQLLGIQVVLQGPLMDRGWLAVDGFERLVAAALQHQPWSALPLSRCLALDRWLRLL